MIYGTAALGLMCSTITWVEEGETCGLFGSWLVALTGNRRGRRTHPHTHKLFFVINTASIPLTSSEQRLNSYSLGSCVRDGKLDPRNGREFAGREDWLHRWGLKQHVSGAVAYLRPLPEEPHLLSPSAGSSPEGDYESPWTSKLDLEVGPRSRRRLPKVSGIWLLRLSKHSM